MYNKACVIRSSRHFGALLPMRLHLVAKARLNVSAESLSWGADRNICAPYSRRKGGYKQWSTKLSSSFVRQIDERCVR
jgi:hypothetical protein